ncbi:MAG: hypothetical protein WBV82_09470 [Myxococcaceae bacterium]
MNKTLGTVLGLAFLAVSSTSFAKDYVQYSDGTCGQEGLLGAGPCDSIINVRGTVTYTGGYYYVSGYRLMSAPQYSTTYAEFIGRRVEVSGTKDDTVKGIWIEIIRRK